MKVTCSPEAKELIRKAFACVINTDAKTFSTLASILPYLDHYELTNGLGMLKDIVFNLAKFNEKLRLPIKLTQESIEESYEIGWHTYANTAGKLDLASLTDVFLSMEIPEQKYEISRLLLTDLLEEFSDIQELSAEQADLPSILLTLKEAIKRDVCDFFIKQMAIATTKEVHLGRKRYFGVTGANELSKVMNAQLDILEQEELQVNAVSSLEEERAVAGNNTYEHLAYFGLEPLDNLGGVVSNLILTISAYEGTGKTKLLCYMKDIFKSQGVQCAIFAGETPDIKLMNEIKAHAFYRTQGGKQVTWKNFMSPKSIEDDDLRAEVSLFNSAYYKTHGETRLMPSLTVGNFRETITNEFNNGTRIFLIDNVSSIPAGSWYNRSRDSAGANKNKIDAVYEAMVELKKAFPISFIVTGWNSTSGGVDLSNLNKVESSRTFAGSSDPSKYSDCYLEMGKSASLHSTLRVLQNVKWREAEITQKAAILDTALACCHFEYNQSIQHLLENGRI